MATYYVDPAAAGSNNGSSWANAWTDFDSAVAAWAAGDIIYCRGTQTISGSSKANGIVLTSCAPGDTTSGAVRIIGCNAAGTPYAGQFTLQGNSGSKPASLLYCANATNLSHTHWHNIDLNGANVTSHAFHVLTTGVADYILFRRVRAFNAGGAGFYLARNTRYCTFVQCVAEGNSSDGFYVWWTTTGGPNLIAFCRSRNNGSAGFTDIFGGGGFYGCMGVNNSGDGLYTDQGNSVTINCVFDGKASGGGHGIATRTTKNGLKVLGCRLTNNATTGKYGIYGSAENDMSHFEDWNVFYGNQAGARYRIPEGQFSVDDPADDGYVDRDNGDFNVKSGAALRSAEVNLFWDS